MYMYNVHVSCLKYYFHAINTHLTGREIYRTLLLTPGATRGGTGIGRGGGMLLACSTI